MTHKPTTDTIADDEFNTISTEEAGSSEQAEQAPEFGTVGSGKTARKQSALRSIEEQCERVRLRRELEDFDFESDRSIELD